MSLLVPTIRELALLADGERGALIAPDGNLVWMCAPAWHSDAVFSSLIGGSGTYRVTPADATFTWGGHYEPGGLIWRNRWVTRTGIIESRDALAFPGDPNVARVLRRIEAIRNTADVDVVLAPAADFGAHPMQGPRLEDGVWTATCGPLRIRWSGAQHARLTSAGELRMRLELQPGSHHDLLLEIADQRFDSVPPSPEALWRATERRWEQAIPSSLGTVAETDSRHALAVLTGLTSRSGAMVAAATMGLPERADRGRSYDYRYAWIRDQCYAGQAAAAVGADALLDDAVRFVSERILDDGAGLKPAYLVTGGRVPDQRHLDLPGYPGGDDLLGNHVNEQFQLDAFGESLLLLAAAADRDRLGTEQWRAVETVAAAIESRRGDPDNGIWELDARHWTHSALECVAGLKAIAKHAPLHQAKQWVDLADSMLIDATAHQLHPSGRWQRAVDDPAMDAALLLGAVRGALPANDPRSSRTLDSALSDLGRQEYMYRFKPDARPLGEAEGAFLLCGFITSAALHQRGDRAAAFRWFERNRAACGQPGTFSEEYDVVQRQLRGNLPQAFVHALMLQTAAVLAD
jgi:GH15 family glucan-1,4-alpha-glucosidase